MPEFEAHPAANIFPMMGEQELSELAEDIRERGLLDSIVIFEDKVLDGRNRMEACKRADVKPRFHFLDRVESPTLYVMSKNLHRRHLTKSQQATIAAEIEPLLREEAKERQRKGGEDAGRGRPKKVPQESAEPIQSDESKVSGDTRELAAKAAGVSHYMVDRARAVKKADPVEFDRVKRGETTLEAAHRKVVQHVPEPPSRKNQSLPAEGTTRREQIDNAAKRRMIDALSHARGLCRGLGELNISAILSACTDEELRTWSACARESAKQLRVFAAKLSGTKETEAA